MAEFSVEATATTITAILSDLSEVSYKRIFYIQCHYVTGGAAATQAEISSLAGETDDIEHTFKNLESSTKYKITITGVNAETDGKIYGPVSADITTGQLYKAQAKNGAPLYIDSVSPEDIEMVEDGEKITFEAVLNSSNENIGYMFSGWVNQDKEIVSKKLSYTPRIEGSDLILTAYAEKVRIDVWDVSGLSCTIGMEWFDDEEKVYSRREDVTYYLNIRDDSDFILEKEKISYDELLDGYDVDGLLNELSTYYINIGYGTNSSNIIWILDNEFTFQTTAKKSYTIHINNGAGILQSQITTSSNASAGVAYEGDSVTFTATNYISGFKFYGWYRADEKGDEIGNGQPINTDNPYVLDKITKDTYLIAKGIPKNIEAKALQPSDYGYSTHMISFTISDTSSAKIDPFKEAILIYGDDDDYEEIDYTDDSPGSFQNLYPNSEYRIQFIFDGNRDTTTQYKDIVFTTDVIETYPPELRYRPSSIEPINQIQAWIMFTHEDNILKESDWTLYYKDANSSTEKDLYAEKKITSDNYITFSKLYFEKDYYIECRYRIEGGQYATIKVGPVPTGSDPGNQYFLSMYYDEDTIKSFTSNLVKDSYSYRDMITVTAIAYEGDEYTRYATPILYNGRDNTEKILSSSGSYTFQITEDMEIYAEGAQEERYYKAKVVGEKYSSTAHTIKVSNLLPQDDISNYYYASQQYIESPGEEDLLTDIKSFTRSSGQVRITGLTTGQMYTYYIYVLYDNSYYFCVGSVTFQAGSDFLVWAWTEDEQDAFLGRGLFSTLTSKRWDEFLSWCNSALTLKNKNNDLIEEDCFIGNKTDKTLYATTFNTILDTLSQIATFQTKELQQANFKTGDVIKGDYFIELAEVMNQAFS